MKNIAPADTGKYSIDLSERVITADGRFYPIEIGEKKYDFPSVTTVLDHVRVKGFLDQWESEFIELMGVDGYKKFLQKKADEGTIVHSLIEFFLNHHLDDNPPIMDRKNIGDLQIPHFDRTLRSGEVNNFIWEKFKKWEEWWDEESKIKTPEVLWQEKVLFSESMGTAGRSDCKMKLDDGVWILDWKSGKVQDKHKIQVATYVKMEEEMTEETLAGGMIISLGEETKCGWKCTEVSNTKKSKDSPLDESEIDYYARGFMLLKKVVDWEFPDLRPRKKSLPRYILPH